MKFNRKYLNFFIISIMLLSLLLYSCNKKLNNADLVPTEDTISSETIEPLSSEILGDSSEITPPESSVSSSMASSSETISSAIIPPKSIDKSRNLPKLPSARPNGNKLTNVRGVWVTTGWNIDFPSDNDISIAQLKSEISAILNKCKLLNLNTIFLQVRSESDALYKSSIFPTSRFLVEKQGLPLKENFDPLTYFIREAHNQNIAIHAWINPYRASVTSISTLADSHPIKKNPDLWLPVKCNGSDGCYNMYCKNQKMLFYDPALPDVQKLVVDGVMEIVRNYDIDGIHLDDYFYPDKQTFPYDDSSSFRKYGNSMNIDDYRRNNTYNLIKSINDNIKNEKKNIYFGVSPGGIWADKSEQPNGSDTINTYGSYANVYADTRLWVKDGILDYIAPQLYLSGDNPRASFDILAKWWSDTVDNTGVSLLIGQASYKTNPTAENGFSTSELGRQIRLMKLLENYNGSIQFSYSDLDRISNELLNN